MDNRIPIIFLPIPSGSSSHSADATILIPYRHSFTIYHTAAVALSVRAIPSHAEG